ncbi:MAG: HEAT repeat domain-containing protein [Planctomycetes bacterium]|nr:HEAT repeat domain-containing protein [Planctomycetota bacterium]
MKDRSLVAQAPALALLFLIGCSGGPEEKKTLTQLVNENTIILSQLASFRSEEQRQGMNRFRKLGKEQGTEVVAYFLSDKEVNDERVQVLLAVLLAEWKDPRGISYLVDRLSSRDSGVVRFAVDGLKLYGELPQIVEPLGEKLKSSERVTRKAAAEVLSFMRGPGAVKQLGSRLKDETDVEIRAACILGIIEAERSEARLELLISALTDPELEIRSLAWNALSREKNIPKVYKPADDLAARAQAVATLRQWAKTRK